MEIIGGVGIGVEVDLSQIDAAFQAAVSKAVADGQSIADALASAVKAPDISGITGSVDQVEAKFRELAQQMADALGITLPVPDTSGITDSLNRVSDAATQTGTAIQSALDVQVPALDTSAAQQSLTDLGTAATTAGQAIVSGLSDVTVPPIDTSASVDSLGALAGAAQQTAQAITTDFAGVQLPPIDTSADMDSFTALDTAAQASLAQIEQYFADAPLPPLNTAPIEDSLHGLADAAGALAAPLGEVADDIEKDKAAATDAQAALADLVQKFKDGEISSGEYISQANALAAALEALGQTAPEVGAGFDRANASLQQFTLGAQDLITKQQEADAALQQAENVLGEIRAAYEQGAVDADTLARAEQNVASAFQAANPAIEQTKTAVDSTTQSMQAMNQVLGVLGVSLGLGAFVHFAESIGEAYDSITRTSISLTKLTGDAQVAAEMIDKLDKLGVSDGLSMPSLQKAAIRMQEFLPAGADIVGTLGEIADAAAASGTSFDSAATKFAMIIDTGKLSAKALKDMGASLDDVKQAMADAGISADKMAGSVQKAFAALSSNDQLVVLQTLLEKFKGTAEDIAENTFQGQWHRATAQFESDINTIIKDVGDLNGKFPDLRKAVDDIAIVFVAVGGTVKAVTDNIANNVAALAIQMQGIGKAAQDALGGNFKQAAKDISDAMDAARVASAKAASDWTSDVGTMKKTIADLENQVKTSVPVAISHLNNLGGAGKDAADKIAAAGVAVQKFIDQIAAGGTVSQLQKDFENASAAINKLATQDLQAAIRAVDDYTQAQIRNGANASVMIEAITKYQALIDKLAKENLPGAIAAEQKLIDEMVSSKQPVELVTAAFEKEEAMIQKLAKDDYPAAVAAAEKLVDTYKNAPQYLSLYNKAVEDLNKLLGDHEAKLNAAEKAQQKFVDSIKNVALGIPAPQKALDDMNRTLDSIGLSAGAMPAKMTPLNQALIDAGRGAEAAGTSLNKIPAALDSIHTPITKVITDLDNLAKDAQNTGQWDNYEAAIDKVGKRFAEMSKTDLPNAVTQFEGIIQEMIKVGAPVDIITGALNKLAPVLQKMSDENLPGAKAAWQGYLDLLAKVPSAIKDVEQADQENLDKQEAILAAMIKRGDAYGYILDQMDKVGKIELDLATKTQQNADAVVLGLEKQKIARQKLADETHGYADIEVKAINDVLGAFDHLGQAIGDALVNGKNMGEALIGEFKKLGASIIGDVINAALLPMKIALEGLIHDALPGLNLGMKEAGAATTALGGASTTTAAAQTTMGVSATGATVAVTGLGIASTLAAIQMNTLITAIAAVIGAIAAIVGDVYLAAIDSKLFITNTTLAAIKNETQTRRSDAWTQYNNTYTRLGEIWNTMKAIMDQIGGGQAGGGANPQSQADLDAIAAAFQPLTAAVRDVNYSVQALNQTSTGYLQTIISNLMDVNHELFVINASIQSKGSGGGGGDSSSGSQSQADVISGAMHDNANAITSSMHAEFGSMLPPIDRIGRVLDATLEQRLRDAQRDYANAGNVADALDALGREYSAEMALANQALAEGNIQQAQEYQQAAAAVERDIASTQEGANYARKTSQAILDYTSQSKSDWDAAEAAQAAAQEKVNADIEALTYAEASGNQKAIQLAQAQLDKDNELLREAQAAAQQAAAGLTYGDAQIVDASKQTGASVVSQVAASGGAVVSAVNNSASTIAAAVDGLMLSQGQTGASAGSPSINGPVSSGGSGGPGVRAADGQQSPVVTNVNLPGGGTGAYTAPLSGTGASASTGTGNPHAVPLGEFPTPKATFDPKTNTYVYQYQTGGMVNTDGLLAAEKGEAVLTPDQVTMLQSISGDSAGAGLSQIGPVADLAQSVTQAQEKVHMDLETLTEAFASGNKTTIELAQKLLEVDQEALTQAQDAAAAQDILVKASQEGQQQLVPSATPQEALPSEPSNSDALRNAQEKIDFDLAQLANAIGSGNQAMVDLIREMLSVDQQALEIAKVQAQNPEAAMGGNPPSAGPSTIDESTVQPTDIQGSGAEPLTIPLQPSANPPGDSGLIMQPPAPIVPDTGNDNVPPPSAPAAQGPPRDVFSGYNPYGANQPFLVPRYQTGGMVNADGLLAAEKGESVLTPDQTNALQSIASQAHVIPQGGQPERVAYGTQGPDAAGIGPAVDAIAEADKKAQDAAKALKERLDLLNQQLAASQVNSGYASVQTIELQNQINDLLKQIADSTDKTADHTDKMANNPPDTGPSTMDIGGPIAKALTDTLSIYLAGGQNYNSSQAPPGAAKYFDAGSDFGSVGPPPGPPPGSAKYFDAGSNFGAQGPPPGPPPGAAKYYDPGAGQPSSLGPPPGAAKYFDPGPPPPTPHPFFSGYNPYGSSQPFAQGAFADGGPVPSDMLAKVHAGEYVLTPDIAAGLRDMLRNPSDQYHFPNPGASQATRQSGPIVINAPITISGAQNGEQIARQLVAHLKRVVPQGGLQS